MTGVRIASGQGFWGDWAEAPYRQVTGGPVDYLMMDYLAEVTMSIMQKQRTRDPSLGYAKDFIPLMERILPVVAERGVRVTTNAGGVNPRGCAEALAAGALGLVFADRRGQRRRFAAELAGAKTRHELDTGRPLADVRDRAPRTYRPGPVARCARRTAVTRVTDWD
jgi:hypothetical protein